MFYELIATFCNQEISLRTGQRSNSNGFSVYACDDAFIKNIEIDINFFNKALTKRQSFDVENLMDDAYLYYVPDAMDPFLVEFHPFNLETQGEVSRGKYLNHVFMGDFSNMYPCETFGESEIWSAKERGLEYYYTNPPPEHLEARTSLIGDERYYNAGRFIMDGRKDTLRSVVAFLISQYEIPIEKRKFLVIIDESAENIENWVTAIEYAFSPRISASIPFATRMDDFEVNNCYTININNNRYEENINYQDPKQKLRYRAMIIGVDSRDSSNINRIRFSANPLYVVLDGRTKEPLQKVDTNDLYYELITSFNEEHREFCREFLQKLKKAEIIPSKDIFNLYETYKKIRKISELNVNALLSVLDTLEKYEPENSIFSVIYEDIRSQLSCYIYESLENALNLYDIHLARIADIVGDTELSERFSVEICDLFIKNLSNNPIDNICQILISRLENHDKLAMDFAKVVLSKEFDFEIAATSSVVIFIELYIKCISINGDFDDKNLKSAVKMALLTCLNNDRSIDCACKIINVLLQSGYMNNIQEFIMSLVSGSNDALDVFIVDCLVSLEEDLFSSDETLFYFCDKLYKANQNLRIIELLTKRIKETEKVEELISFKKTINKKIRINDSVRKELDNIIATQCCEIIDMSAESFFTIKNYMIEKYCDEIYRNGLGTSTIIKTALIKCLNGINTIEDINKLLKLKYRPLINKESDLIDFKKRVLERRKEIINKDNQVNKEIFSSNKNTEKYCKMLCDNGCGIYIKLILNERLNIIGNSNKKLIEFIDFLINFKIDWINQKELEELFEKIDSKINVLDDEAGAVFLSLSHASKDQSFVNSAHAYVLKFLSDKKKRMNLKDKFEKLKKHSFLSLDNRQYANDFIKVFLHARPTEEEIKDVFCMFSKLTTKIYFEIYFDKIMEIAGKNIKPFNSLLLSVKENYQTYNNLEDANRAICDTIKKYKYTAKRIGEIVSGLEDDWSQKYITELVIKEELYPLKEIIKFIISEVKNNDTRKDISNRIDKILKAEGEKRLKHEKF